MHERPSFDLLADFVTSQHELVRVGKSLPGEMNLKDLIYSYWFDQDKGEMRYQPPKWQAELQDLPKRAQLVVYRLLRAARAAGVEDVLTIRLTPVEELYKTGKESNLPLGQTQAALIKEIF